MADGSWHRTAKRIGAGVKLNQAAAGRATLWARCGCGQETVLDPAPWLGQGLARHPLADLENRVRCHCGARHARLEIRGLSEAPHASAGGLFIFRVRGLENEAHILLGRSFAFNLPSLRRVIVQGRNT